MIKLLVAVFYADQKISAQKSGFWGGQSSAQNWARGLKFYMGAKVDGLGPHIKFESKRLIWGRARATLKTQKSAFSPKPPFLGFCWFLTENRDLSLNHGVWARLHPQNRLISPQLPQKYVFRLFEKFRFFAIFHVSDHGKGPPEGLFRHGGAQKSKKYFFSDRPFRVVLG